MSTVKKKPAAKKAAKKAAPKKPPVDVNVEGEEMPAPEPAEKEEGLPMAAEAVTKDQVEAMIDGALNKAVNAFAEQTKQMLQMVTEKSPQALPDKAAPPPVLDDDHVDLELLDLTDPIAAQLAREDGAKPGGKRVEAEALQTNPLTAEQIASMSDEEIDEYNRNEMRKLQARKQAQVVNRAKLEKMSPADRIRALTNRDPNIIREADNPLGERMVQCRSVRRIGLGEQGTSDVDEIIKVPLSGARILQDAGAIKVLI